MSNTKQDSGVSVFFALTASAGAGAVALYNKGPLIALVVAVLVFWMCAKAGKRP